MKNVKKIIAPVIAMVLCFVFVISSFAATNENKPESAEQTVKVIQEVVAEENGKAYEQPEKIEFLYTIKGHQSSTGKYPMPDETSFRLKGNDRKDLKLVFTEEGIYEYELTRESSPEGVRIPEARVRYFGFKVDENLNVIPYTCTDPDAEIEEHLNGIILRNTLYGKEKKSEPEKKPSDNGDKKDTNGKKTIRERIQTNDPFNIAIWVIILIAAVVAILLIMKKRKKSEDTEDKNDQDKSV